MKKNEDRLLVKIAQMYYEENKTQSEISKILGIHRTSISRMLKTIREKKIVKIFINYDFGGTLSLEEELKSVFGLRDAVIVPSTPNQDKKIKVSLIGAAAADYLGRIVKDNDLIGVSWGEALAETVNAMEKKDCKGVVCIPLIGGPSGKLASSFHVNTIAYEIASKLNGKSMLIDSPAICESEEIKKELMETEYNHELSELWKKINIAVCGIGSPLISKHSNWQGFYADNLLESLKGEQVAGDILSRFYDINGKVLDTIISKKMISSELDNLKNADYSIGIAESLDKVAGILGALRGKYINVLVTTEETAEAVLKMNNKA